MTLKVDWLTFDAHDPQSLAEFWEQALTDYEVLPDPDDDSDEEVPLMPTNRRGPKILFIKVPDDKVIKNRLHLDLRPDDGTDQKSEVARLEALGARKVDIGQGDVRWVVMSDPEGNEFCVLRALTDEEKEKYAAWSW